LRIGADRTKAAGADVVFLEFNDPRKMTAEQMAEDAESGISTQDRQKLWGASGIHVAVDSKGQLAPYGQPSMDGLPPVDYLSLGFIGGESLMAKPLSVADYLAIARSAHSTMPGVDLDTDPTVTAYTAECLRNPDKYFTLKPLSSLVKEQRLED